MAVGVEPEDGLVGRCLEVAIFIPLIPCICLLVYTIQIDLSCLLGPNAIEDAVHLVWCVIGLTELVAY